MSRPDFARDSFPDGDGGLVFAEQWHAQVVAVVELLIANKNLDATEWSQTLGAEVDRRVSEGAEDADANYYNAFLRALEQILARERFAALEEVDRRVSDWRKAYLSTPHGNPVVLKD